MLKIVSAGQMKVIDGLAAEQLQIPGIALMERAGSRLAEACRDLLGRMGREAKNSLIVVVAGSGKNGGDGLVCARFLHHAGIQVKVLLLANSSPAPETMANLTTLKSLEVAVEIAASPAQAWVNLIGQSDLAVDALLGIGLTGRVRPEAAAVIRILNASGVPVLAADIPSGLNADTGEPGEPTVRAIRTLTFGAPKAGLFETAAVPFVGALIVDSLAFPEGLIRAGEKELAFLDPATARLWLPQRSLLDHKKTAGRVLVIGGSRQYHGALLLAGQGAVRSGAGYVTLAYPEKLNATIRAHAVEELCAPMPGTEDGDFSLQALEPILRLAQENDAVILGPGLGRQEASQRLVQSVLTRLRGPKALILDADGLAALVPEPRDASQPTLVLTPHAGEAGRLLGVPADRVAAEPRKSARQLSDQFQACTLLKGRHTVIADESGRILISSTGTPALATAGTGDVLSGVIASMATHDLKPWQAAGLAAFVHGRAGELASVDPGGLGVRARDVAEALPRAFRELRLTENRPEFKI